jgi:hypothetical protein
MTTRTRLFTRLAVVAVLALVLGLVGVGGMATTASATDSPGQSNHCPADSIQVRFEGAGTHDGFTVVEESGYLWRWTYDGVQQIGSIWVFGGNTLEEVGGTIGTSGTIDAELLGLINHGGQVAEISHVDFCMVRTFKVIPQKVWDFGDEMVPADGEAVITIDAGEGRSKSWAFDTSGAMKGEGDDLTALELPVGTEYTVTERVTAPAGFTCERVEPVVSAMGKVTEPTVETVYNRCVERPPVTLPPVIVTVPPVTDTTPEPETTTTTLPTEVESEVVEQTTTTVVEVLGEALPRTGGSIGLALVGTLGLALGGGLVATARRRELES